MTGKYFGLVKEILDDGDALVELSPELLKELDWREGDEIDIVTKDKKIIVKNLSKENRNARDNNHQTSNR